MEANYIQTTTVIMNSLRLLLLWKVFLPPSIVTDFSEYISLGWQDLKYITTSPPGFLIFFCQEISYFDEPAFIYIA